MKSDLLEMIKGLGEVVTCFYRPAVTNAFPGGEAGEEMEVGTTPDGGATNRDFSPGTTRELLQDLSGDDWANTATPPLGSPRKNLELPLASEPSQMGMVLLTDEVREKNTFEGNIGMFLSTLDEEAWQSFLSEFNQRVENKAKVDDFKEELWETVVKFGEPVLIGTGLDEKVRKELLEKMIGLRKQKQDTGANPCKDNSTLNKKTDDKKICVEVDHKNKTSNMIKESEKRDLDKEVKSVMVVKTPPSRGVRSRKRKREAEEASPSVNAVSEKNLKEKAPMIQARWKTAAYKGGSAARKLTQVMVEVEASTTPGKEEDFKPQKANAKREFTSGKMWEVDVRK